MLKDIYCYPIRCLGIRQKKRNVVAYHLGIKLFWGMAISITMNRGVPYGFKTAYLAFNM